MNKFFICILISTCFLIYANSAFAYLDPGTGSMILQAVLGAFLFIGTAVGVFWQRIKKFFSGSKKSESEE